MTKEIRSARRLEKDKKKTGRPKTEVDYELLKSLCRIQCTKDEICAVMKIPDSTLSARIEAEKGMTFWDYKKIYSKEGEMSLRRVMYEAAIKYKKTDMMRFLAKQYLGMSEKEEIKQEGYIVNEHRLTNEYRQEQLDLTLKARQLKIEQEQKKRDAYEHDPISGRENTGDRVETREDGGRSTKE